MALCRKAEKEAGIGQMTGIIFTDGGGPNSTQRVEFNGLLKGREVISAIVSDSLVVRGIVSALGLFNPRGLKVFTPPEWKKALNFARVPELQHLEVMRVVVALGREVGDPKVRRTLGM